MSGIRHDDIEALAADQDADLALRVLASEWADELAATHELIRWIVKHGAPAETAPGEWLGWDDDDQAYIQFPDDLAAVLAVVVGS